MPTDTFDLGTVQDTILDAVKQGQERTLDALRVAADFASPVTSRLPKAPLADQLPDPAASVDAGYEFVEKWLAVQRAFAKEVAAVLTPAGASTDAS
jgi:hypothetical protein